MVRSFLEYAYHPHATYWLEPDLAYVIKPTVIIITHYNYVYALSICVYIIHQLIDVMFVSHRSKVGALDSVCSERQRKVKGYLQ